MEVDITDLSLADTAPRADKPASNAGGEEELTRLAARGFDLLYGRVGAVDSIAASPDTRGAVLSLPEGPRDEAAGHRLLKEAAERGHAAAQYSTALQYQPGGALAEGDAEKNKAESLTWIQGAAVQGHAEAQMTLGAQYWLNGLDGHRQVS
jgi:TPR repeat protein